jgi:hypothetical protein
MLVLHNSDHIVVIKLQLTALIANEYACKGIIHPGSNFIFLIFGVLTRQKLTASIVQ